jgi:hypothetical protein
MRSNKPTSKAYFTIAYDNAANKFSLGGYSKFNSNSKVCLWLRFSTALPTGSNDFDISVVYYGTQVMAKSTVSIVLAATPSGKLIGLLKNSLFGYLEYMDRTTNYKRNSLGYLNFRLALGFTPTLGG